MNTRVYAHLRNRNPAAAQIAAAAQSHGYLVLLASCGNPGHGQNPSVPLWGTPADHWVVAASMEEASAVVRAFIMKYHLDRFTWAGGEVRNGANVPIGRIAFDARTFTRVALPKMATQARPVTARPLPPRRLAGRRSAPRA
jgi:hypothetical protein